MSKAAVETFASKMADETLQNKVKAAEELFATTEQKRCDAEQNAIASDQKRVAAEGKTKVAESRATAAEALVDALRAQLRLSEEAKGIAQASQTDAIQQAKSTVEEANRRIEGAERSRLLSEQVQQRLLFDANAADHQVGELKAKIGEQEEELARMSRMKDELARTKSDLDAHKFSLGDWVQGCTERDGVIRAQQENIVKLGDLMAKRDEMVSEVPHMFGSA